MHIAQLCDEIAHLFAFNFRNKCFENVGDVWKLVGCSWPDKTGNLADVNPKKLFIILVWNQELESLTTKFHVDAFVRWVHEKV